MLQGLGSQVIMQNRVLGIPLKGCLKGSKRATIRV